LHEALRLSPEERAALAAALLDSLDEGVDEGAEAAWASEIATARGAGLRARDSRAVVNSTPADPRPTVTRHVARRRRCRTQGYTPGMKVAVSVPDDVFEEAEQLARRTKRSRSEVYSRALAEYLARHAPDRVTAAMDRALEEIGEPNDQFVRAASRRALKRSDW